MKLVITLVVELDPERVRAEYPGDMNERAAIREWVGHECASAAESALGVVDAKVSYREPKP